MRFYSASDYWVCKESILELIDLKDFFNFPGDSDTALIVSLLKKLFFSTNSSFRSWSFHLMSFFLAEQKKENEVQ